MQLMGAVLPDSAGTTGDQNALGFGFLIRHNQTGSERLKGLRTGLMEFFLFLPAGAGTIRETDWFNGCMEVIIVQMHRDGYKNS